MKHLIWLLLISTGFAQTISTLNGTTVGASAGNISGWNGTTIGTTAGNIGAWNGLTSPGGGGGTVSLVTHATFHGYNDTSTLHTSLSTNSVTTAAGNFLACGIRGNFGGNSVTLTSVTSTLGTFTVLAGQAEFAGGNSILYLAYAKNITGGTGTVTANYSGNNNFDDISCVELSGANTTTPIDTVNKVCKATNSGSSGSCSFVQSSATGELTLLWGDGTNTGSGSFTAGTNFTLIESNTLALANEYSTTAGISSPSITLSTSRDWLVYAMTVKP